MAVDPATLAAYTGGASTTANPYGFMGTQYGPNVIGPSTPWGYQVPSAPPYTWGADPNKFSNSQGGNPYSTSTTIPYSSDHTPLSINSPGSIDPSQVNPYAAQYLQNNQNMYNQFSQSAAGGAFNPAFYKGMQDTSQANLTTSLSNQYARMGLSGSSAEMGGESNAIQQNQMSWLNRQQSDQSRAMQGMEGLNNQGYSETMGLQSEWAAYQQEVNQDELSLYGVQQQQSAANNQMWSGIAQAGVTAVGVIAAPYTGGASLAGASAIDAGISGASAGGGGYNGTPSSVGTAPMTSGENYGGYNPSSYGGYGGGGSYGGNYY